MKNEKINFVALLLLMFLSIANVQNAFSQNSNFRKRIAVISMKATDVNITDEQAGKLLRNALIGLDTFEVIDEFDMEDVFSEADISFTDCFASSCLAKAGNLLNADYMLTGSVEKLLDKIVISLRIIDVKDKRIIKRKLIEFIDVNERMKQMIKITLNEMMGKEIDSNIKKALTNENQYESNINIPGIEKLSLTGPRIGLFLFTGDEAKIISAPTKEGGFDGRPVFFQFGYQFEISYLNAGRIQALFEIIPMISGVDQGNVVPSFTFLNGVRLNTNGFEFAVGPTFIFTKKAKGYYDGSNNWHVGNFPEDIHNDKFTSAMRLDSRGEAVLDAGLVLALGKSFKSGKVNFPLNMYMVLKKKTVQFGLSFGFNANTLNKKPKKHVGNKENFIFQN